jgi:hypothetical protein
MRNARQELFVHINALESSLEDLTRRIERMFASVPDAEGVRRMPWPATDLPAPVVCALLEGYRHDGRHVRIEGQGNDLYLILRLSEDAVPIPVMY